MNPKDKIRNGVHFITRLRNEIVLNSLFIRDYENSFEIDPHLVCNFFNGYLEYLEEMGEEESKESLICYYEYLSGDIFD